MKWCADTSEKLASKWFREETILAFDLYCKIPFSKISSKNEDIIRLANLIGRTPSSVGLKDCRRNKQII